MRNLITNVLRHAAMPSSGSTTSTPASGEKRPGSWTINLKNAFSLQNLFGWPPAPLDPARETAWLDGLRGVAAFLVMTYHFHLTFWTPFALEAPFGGVELTNEGQVRSDRNPHYELWRLPILRLWMGSGHAQVSVFFVLSGFVLSWGPLRLIQRGELEKFAQNLGSAALRRWIRLFLPCFAVALWECFELYFGIRSMPKPQMENLFAQLWDYAWEQMNFANPFLINRNGQNSLNAYDFTMWTIPYEWAGSLLIFLVLLMICRVKSFLRRSMVLLAVTLWACIRAEWNFFLFSAGMCIANYVRYMGGFKNLSPRRWRSSIAWTVLLIVALFLAGTPENSVFFTRPGYGWMASLTPERWLEHEGGVRFWWCWAGIFFITAACHLPRVRGFFEFGLMRHLGRISFMLYLTHRIVLNLLGARFEKIVLSIFGREVWIDGADGKSDPFGTFVIYLILMSVLLPTSTTVAHWCERLIDAPSTRFARSVDVWFTKDLGETIGAVLPTHHSSAEEVRREEQIELLPRGDGTNESALEQREMREVIYDAATTGGAEAQRRPP